MRSDNAFHFEISLSVLNHLGRNLYRSFATVLGEAISNAWDADAENVYIYIDREKNCFLMKDDGIGMAGDDFQKKFLKIGYSKRKEGKTSSLKGRHYIGRKGIGKLALLSCAQKIVVLSKKLNEDYVGGVINNRGLDRAMSDDLAPGDYTLGKLKKNVFDKYKIGHDHGTIIYFKDIKDGIKHSLDFLEKIVALYFRFSLLDEKFNIYINDKLVTLDSLHDLALKTEFLWKINDLDDPYFSMLKTKEQTKIDIKENKGINGFIASVEKPLNLKILTMEERVGVDLFVNGRLRERDILKHIPTARVVESYLYGQIHFNGLDDNIDRFASSRESIVAGDPKYKEFLDSLKDKVMNKILNDWDKWRVKHREAGDSDNTRITSTDRKSKELYNVVSEEYMASEAPEGKEKIEKWVGDLSDDATYNFASYAECFISENLIRKFIQENNLVLSKEAEAEIANWKNKEEENKNKGNISIEIRKGSSELSFLSMDGLANLVDKKDPSKEACLSRDAKEYKPVRDALSHTALLTDEAKLKLTSVYSNIKGRIMKLLSYK